MKNEVVLYIMEGLISIYAEIFNICLTPCMCQYSPLLKSYLLDKHYLYIALCCDTRWFSSDFRNSIQEHTNSLETMNTIHVTLIGRFYPNHDCHLQDIIMLWGRKDYIYIHFSKYWLP